MTTLALVMYGIIGAVQKGGQACRIFSAFASLKYKASPKPKLYKT
jgi:hypothetical protein